MNLTTKGRYAVSAMVDLALYSNKKPVCLAEIAERQNIALSYLEQIFMRLRKAGLVKSVRGPGGGYILATEAAEMPIASIVTAVDESIKMTRCGGKEMVCTQSKGKCMTHNLWEGLSHRIHDYLNSVSLADVCNKNNNFKENGANVAHLS